MDTRQATATQTAATGCWLGCGLVDRTVAPGGLVTAQVVFPSPEATLVPRPLGHVRGRALLRLIDGTVWMLALPGKAWTRSRVLSAASVLSEALAGAEGDAERRIRKLPGLEGVTVETPCLATADPLQWDLCRTATAVVARSAAALGRGTAPGDTRDQIRRVEATLQRLLTAALADFVAGMDAEICGAASRDGTFDLALYNYLVREPFRRFRLQFAATFPSLVRVTMEGTPGTLGAELRAIVDEGRPLVRGLAARWNVRPGVIRHLVGQPPELVGTDWVARPGELAVLLDALRPEDLPAETAGGWQQFNEAVAIGRRLFRKPLYQSEAGLEWLRACVHQTRRGSQASRLRWLPDPAALREINRFRDALAENLRRDAGGATHVRAQALSLACEDVVDRFLSHAAGRGLATIAADYQGALADLWRQLREARRLSRVASGDELWPLVPADLLSSDGTRLVRSLRTLGELTAHGAALANCLGRGYAARYLCKGSQGSTFIVGLFDAATGAPCSTAEVAIRRYAATHTYDLAIVQHTARNNAKPSPCCIQAVEDLLRYCRGADIRRHLEQGWWLLAARGSRRSRRHDQVEDLATVRMALRQCLGDQTYDGLLAELLQARSNTPSADPAPL